MDVEKQMADMVKKVLVEKLHEQIESLSDDYRVLAMLCQIATDHFGVDAGEMAEQLRGLTKQVDLIHQTDFSNPSAISKSAEDFSEFSFKLKEWTDRVGEVMASVPDDPSLDKPASPELIADFHTLEAINRKRILSGVTRE